MHRTTTLALAVILVISVAVVPLGAAEAAANDTEQRAQGTNDSIAPGEQLTGVLGVQMAEVDGEIENRSFGIQLANAETNETKAAVIGEQFDDIDERITALEERRETLEAEREAGNISEGEYRAEIATIEAETRTAERLTNSTESNVTDLPTDTLEEQGVNVSAIQTLSDRANELSGPETAEIARSIAGNSVGNPVADDRGPGGPAGAPGDSVGGNDTHQNETPSAAGDIGEPQRGDDTTDDSPPERRNDTTDDTPAERDQDAESGEEAEDGGDVDGGDGNTDSDSDGSEDGNGESAGSTVGANSDDRPSANDARTARPAFE